MIPGVEREWRTPKEAEEHLEIIARSLWIQAEITRLKERVDLLEARMRVLMARMDECEGGGNMSPIGGGG